MRLGIVDIGTISLRFDVYETEAPYASTSLIHRYRSMPRIGRALSSHLHESLPGIVEEFQKLRLQCEEQGVDDLLVVGTSALRDSTPGKELVEQIATQTSIHIEVLSGEEEARLTALGIFANEPKLTGRIALADVGGGSTEISFCQDGKIVKALSIDVGASRLEQLFFKHRDPATSLLTPESLVSADKYIQDQLEPVRIAAKSFSLDLLVGSSGTVRSLERLRIDPHPPAKRISLSAITRFTDKLRNSTHNEILSFPGMERNRADVILPGCLILQALMKILNAPEIQVTHFSLRHGVLEEALKKLRLVSKS